MYTIMYHPWESTEVHEGWFDAMNRCDEVWSPSPLIAKWYKDFVGITKPIYVFEHGVDKIWEPVERKFETPFKFLHVGGEAARKGVKEAMQARRIVFGAEPAEITIKVMTSNWPMIWQPNVNVINSRQSIEELIKMFHDHHAYVYPSYGEGFGLTPLQALATGMPVITVADWAPYAKFLDPELIIGSKMIKSPWPRIHPGNMLEPDMGDLQSAMLKVRNNYDYYVERALARVPEIQSHYDWDRLTEEAFSDLSNRLVTV
jgi:glycosyltransferase involved in cell wall biosynthesis